MLFWVHEFVNIYRSWCLAIDEPHHISLVCECLNMIQLSRPAYLMMSHTQCSFLLFTQLNSLVDCKLFWPQVVFKSLLTLVIVTIIFIVETFRWPFFWPAAGGHSSGSRGGVGGGEGQLHTHHDSVCPSEHHVPPAEGTNRTETGPVSISAGPPVFGSWHASPQSTLSHCWLEWRPELFVLPLSVWRHKEQGSRLLVPLEGEVQPGRTLREVAEVGRATVWCQVVIVEGPMDDVFWGRIIKVHLRTCGKVWLCPLSLGWTIKKVLISPFSHVGSRCTSALVLWFWFLTFMRQMECVHIPAGLLPAC